MVHREGQLFGEAVLVGSTERSSTAIALSAGRALALDDDALLRLTAARPELAVRLLKQLVVRAREAEERIESMLIADTQSRVVDALLRLVSQGRREGSKAGSVTLGISPMGAVRAARARRGRGETRGVRSAQRAVPARE